MNKKNIVFRFSRSHTKRFCDYFSQSNDVTTPLAIDEYKILHLRMINDRNMYLQTDCYVRMLDFWRKIITYHASQYRNCLKMVEALLIAQLNIATNERLFGQRKLIL